MNHSTDEKGAAAVWPPLPFEEAPPHPGAPGVAGRITREAYSHEVSSAGFWPGGDASPEPVFYSYAYPEPAGFADYNRAPQRRRG